MAEFIRTTKAGKGRASHSHIVYMRDDGTAHMTIDHDHTHEILPDEITGISISTANGHTHELDAPVEPVEQKNTDTDEDIVSGVMSLYEEAKSIEAESMDVGLEVEDFIRGDQWDEATKNALNAANRAALTINEFESKHNLLSGYQRQNRTDMKFNPVEEGDAKIASISDYSTKIIWEQNNAAYEETEVFEDGVIAKGGFNIYMDYDSNPEGDIRIERYPWHEFMFGPHNKKDASDAEYLIKTKWYSRSKLKDLWPEEYERISPELDILHDSKKPHVSYRNDQYDNSKNRTPLSKAMGNDDYVNLAKKEYRVIECQRKSYVKVPIFIDDDVDYIESLDGWSSSDVTAVKTISIASVIRRKTTKMRITTIAAHVLLEDDNSPDLAIQEFDIVPFYAKKRGNYYWGALAAGLDLQRETNKRHSQMADILNKVASYGWLYDKDTFPDEKAKENFKDGAASPGFIGEIENTERPPKMMEGVKFPSELAQMQQLESAKLKEILNINDEMQGTRGPAQSGVAIAERRRQGLIGNEYLFDNLNLTKRRLARIMIAMLQKYYEPERIARMIMNRSGAETSMNLGGQPIQEFTEQNIVEMLQDRDMMKYDVVLSESAYNPTTRIANLLMMTDLASHGYPIPPDVIIDLMDIPEKEKIKQAIQAQAQAAQSADERKDKTEIAKTLLAQGADVSTLQQQGLLPQNQGGG